jgi:hypothetical protein
MSSMTERPLLFWTTRNTAALIAMLVLGWLALGWPWLSGALTIPWDAKAHFYPQLQFLAQSLHSGQSPFWAPQVFGGHPQIADPQSLIFSPPFLLLALFDGNPGFRAADAAIFAMLLLGALALVLLFRDRDWHPAGALVAGLSFAFGASAAWRLQHLGQILSLSWFAITLFLLSRALERRSAGYGFASGLAAGFMVLGRDQVALLGVYVLAGLVIAAWLTSGAPLKAMRASLKPLIFGAAGAILIAAIPILLTLALAEQSNRPVIDLDGAHKGSLHPLALLTGVVANLFRTAGPLVNHWGPPSPAWDAAFGGTNLYLARNMSQLYLGLTPLLLILTLGLVRGRMWRREIIAITIAALAMLVFTLGRYTPGFEVMFKLLPGIDLYRRPADGMFILGALFAILGGYLVHRLLTDNHVTPKLWQRLLEILLIAGFFAASVALAQFVGKLDLAVRPLLVAALCLSLTLGALVAARGIALRGAVLAPALILGATLIVDLAVNNGPNESTALPPASYNVLRPETGSQTIAELKRNLARTSAPDRRDRIELAGIDFAWPNASLIHGFDNTLGYNPVRLGLYSQATGAGDHVALPDQRSFSPLMPSYRSLLADMLGLRFIATGVPVEEIDKSLKPGDLKLLIRTNESYIYENPRAMPRVMLATEALPADFDSLLKTGQWPVFDPQKTVLLETLAPVPVTATPPAMAILPAARLVSYANAEVVAEAMSPRGGWLVLNDVWQRWWTVEINGQPAKLLRANVLFRAVRVPPGRVTVRFVYKPLEGLASDLKARASKYLPAT